MQALFSGTTGIIDVHAVMSALYVDAIRSGATFCFNTTVLDGEPHDDQLELILKDGQVAEYSVPFDYVINCAGLGALRFARQLSPRGRMESTNDDEPSSTYYHVPSHVAKGHYFQLRRPEQGRPFQSLVYPIPEDASGLGIHSTLDVLDDSVTRFGPNVDWILGSSEPLDYRVDESLRDEFIRHIRRYFPDIKPQELVPDYAGIRPKLYGQAHSSEFVDFQIHVRLVRAEYMPVQVLVRRLTLSQN